jgi:hypothetical protein
LSILVGGLILLGVAALVASLPAADAHVRASSECANLSRIVAGRSHSMLDGRVFRSTEQQAYRTCVSDPAAFRRIVR